MTKLDDDVLAAWRGFLNAHAQITRRISRDLAAADVPVLSWYDLLWALYRQPERRMRITELARETVLSPTGMSRLVDRVEASGCVRREPDPADRRALRVVLTLRDGATQLAISPVLRVAPLHRRTRRE